MDSIAHAVVLSIDDKSQIQALERTRPDQPLDPSYPAAQTHDYTRHGTTTLFAALIGEEQDDRKFAFFWRRHDLSEIQAHVREAFWGSFWFARITRVVDEPTLLDALTPASRSHALE